jgi:beta-glucanase (GH16 family)
MPRRADHQGLAGEFGNCRWLGSTGIFRVAMLRPALLALTLSAAVVHADPEGWKLVWSDEFDGKELDFAKWGAEENGHGGGNGELQYYVDRHENVRVENGHLVIEARKEKFNAAGVEKDYTSGRIRTKRRASWRHGRFEIRAKLPSGRGIWPAIWMLPEKENYGGWAASGEIDIMELVGHEPAKVHGTLHHGASWPKNVHTGKPFELKQGSFADDFHTFAIEWEKGEIRWYVDGELYQTQTKWSSTGGAFPAPFDQPFHLILNVAVGGAWPGPPDAGTVFPQRMTVDWVRVYQRP